VEALLRGSHGGSDVRAVVYAEAALDEAADAPPAPQRPAQPELSPERQRLEAILDRVCGAEPEQDRAAARGWQVLDGATA